MTESEANQDFIKQPRKPVFCPKTAVSSHFSEIVSPIFPKFVFPNHNLIEASGAAEYSAAPLYFI